MRLRTIPLLASLWLAPHSALAQASDAQAEARVRFDRGLLLFNDGDSAGALAEFKRAYEIVPNAVVLYNIGLVYAAMRRPVEATAALESVLSKPDVIGPERRARAARTRDEQAARVGQLVVRVNVEGAIVEVDNIEVAKSGAAPTIVPVAEGARIVDRVRARSGAQRGHRRGRREERGRLRSPRAGREARTSGREVARAQRVGVGRR